MISWVVICKFMQFNIIFKTIFEYIHKKFRFVHTNTFCKYRKKLLASPRVHLVLYIELLLRYPQTIRTCPSSVEITLARGYTSYAECFEIRHKYQHRGYACLKKFGFEIRITSTGF